MKKFFVYLLSLGHLSVDLAPGALPAVLPFLVLHNGLSYTEVAGLMFASSCLSSFVQPLFGFWADKSTKNWFLSLGILTSGIGLGLSGLATNYWLIFLCSMFSGFGSSIYHPEAARMVNNIAGDRKGQAMGTFSVGGNAGFAIGPMVAGACAYAFDIHGLVVFGIVNALIAFVLYHQMPHILSLVSEAATAEKKAHPGEVRTNDWSAFARLSVVIFVRSIGFTVCNTFIPLYWIHVLHASPATGSLALSILFSMGVVITFIGGVLADRFGFLRVLRGSMVIMIPSMFFLVNSTDIVTATLLLFPVAFSLFAAYSPIVVLGQTYLGKNVGFASGVTLGLTTTIGGLISPIVGWGADQWGISPALQCLWISAIIGAIFAFLIPVPKAWRH